VGEVWAEVGEFRDRAVYSDDMLYRYEFERRWADGPTCVWVLLNPATGDTDGKPRPTLARCIQRSRDWGCGSVTVVNLFAFRATKPRDLLSAVDPVGERNDAVLARVLDAAPRVVAAWGAHGRLLGRGHAVLTRLPRGSLCLGFTRRGQPRHPLYVPASTEAMVLDDLELARSVGGSSA
jgi:hypothetical protein